MCRANDGVEVRTVELKSFISKSCREVKPPLLGTTVAPTVSAPL